MITLNKLSIYDLYSTYFKVNNKWGVVVWLPSDEDATTESLQKQIEFSLPLWNKYWKTITDVLIDGCLFDHVAFLCDSEDEMWEVYNQIRGDDGLPNDKTPGDCFAVGYSNEGIQLLENT